MSVTKTQLTGGAFQDTEGNLLVNGYLTMKLSQDENISGVGNVCAGVEVRIQLDSDGNVASSSSTPPVSDQYVWANDVMLPVNSFYKVTGYTVQGQPAWGPNNQQVTSGGTGGGTFDTGTWIPNSVFSWTPPLQPLLLQTNEVINGSQGLLDLHAGLNISLTDNGVGMVTISELEPTVSNQTGSNHTAVLADANNIITMNNGGANTVTVPANATTAFLIGSTLTLVQLGAGQSAFLAAGGVTIHTPASLSCRVQYSTISVIKIAVNTWVAAGDLT